MLDTTEKSGCAVHNDGKAFTHAGVFVESFCEAITAK